MNGLSEDAGRWIIVLVRRLEQSKIVRCGKFKVSADRWRGAQHGSCFDRNDRAILSLQFLHNIPYVDFHRALAHIQVVGHYFVRLTLLDGANDS